MDVCSSQTDLALSADQRQRLLEARQQVLPEIQRIVAERERLTTCLQVSPFYILLGLWIKLPPIAAQHHILSGSL